MHRVTVVACLATLLTAPSARAQRADENAVTAASDAFGTVVGTQTIGLYSPTSARGFNPTQAENLRIEGFYYDQQPQSSNPYLFSGSDMRVGIAAQSYAFPSPSGIADYHLRIPGHASGASAVLIRGPLDAYSAELDGQAPLANDRIGLGFSVAAEKDFDIGYALKSTRRAIAVEARLQPSPMTEIVPFFGYIYNTERRETPFVYATGHDVVPYFQEQELPTQPWTTWAWNQVTAGVIATVALGGPWTLKSGIFRSLDENSTNYNDLLLDVGSNGMGDRVLDVSPAHRLSSYSGDVRAVRMTDDGTHRRELTFSVRGRHVDREFGGDFVYDFGNVSIFDPTELPKPAAISFGVMSRDVVTQSGVGVNYSDTWKGVGSVNLGVLRTQYRRVVTSTVTATDVQETTEVLPTLSFTLDATRLAKFYGSYTRGLEDSVMAPASASNRGELPPATSTWQADGGVRLLIRPTVQWLLGGFRIHKAYFAVDQLSRIYSQLGVITSDGAETSMTVSGAGGLTVVAGAVWLRPKVELRAPADGTTSGVPVGPVPRTVNVNLDYAPPALGGWAGSLQWKSLSSRIVSVDGSESLGPLSTLNVAVRYLLKLRSLTGSARFEVDNATNQAGVTVSPLLAIVPQLKRTYVLTLTIDL